MIVILFVYENKKIATW